MLLECDFRVQTLAPTLMSWNLGSIFAETTLLRIDFRRPKLISRLSPIYLHTFRMYSKPSINRKTRERFISEKGWGQHFLSGWNSLYWSVADSWKLIKDNSQMHLEGFEAIRNVLGCLGMPLWYQSWSFGKFVERSRWAGIPPYQTSRLFAKISTQSTISAFLCFSEIVGRV